MPHGSVDFLAKATKPLTDLQFDEPATATAIAVTPAGWKLAQARLVDVDVDELRNVAACVHAIPEEAGYKERVTVASTAASALRTLMDVATTIAAIDHGQPDSDHELFWPPTVPISWTTGSVTSTTCDGDPMTARAQ